jgi:Peptidase family M28
MRTDERQFAAATSGRALWLTLAVLLALGAITHWADRPPAPQPADAPADVFSAGRAAQVLQELVGTGIPHPLASAADARIREQLVQHLNALGVATELQEGWACDLVLACGRVVNIIGRIEGTEPASAGVLLAAHYDSVPAGPGAGDDGIGVASILEIARVLKQQPQRRHPIILLIDEGEEAGLLGARLFVAERPEAHTIKAAVNLDARGDSGPSLMFETGQATNWALRMFAGVVARPMSNSLYYFVYKLLPNDTDFTVFKATGYEGFNFALIGDVERYHTPQDRLENLDLGSLQHQGQNALSVVQALAMADLATPPAAGAVFFDVFSRALWHWPASWSLWLGLALTAALVYALRSVKRRVGVTALAIVYGLAALMIGWAGAVVVSAALLTLVRAAGAVPPAAAYSWAAFPDGMHAACIALALLAPACAARLFRRRIDAWSLWFAYLKVQAALALLCAWKFPELSYLFFSPVLAGLIAALLAMRLLPRAPAKAPPPPLTAALPVVGAAFTFIPILLLLYPGLGAEAWPVITALSGLAALGLAPLLLESPARSFRAYAGGAALIVIVGSGVTLVMPAYSTQMPQRTLLWYLLDADAGQAAWLLQPDSKSLPPQVALHTTRKAQQKTLPTGIIAGPVVSTAPHLDYPAPLLQILGVENRASTVFYHLHVRSVRNAPEIELAVADDRVVEATLDLGAEHKLPAHFWHTADGSRWLQLIGVPPEGLDLTLETSNATDLAVTVLDRSYGVPETAVALRSAQPALTTQSQDGDLTIVYRSVRLSAAETAPGS